MTCNKLRYFTSNGTPLALSNLCYRCSVAAIEDAVEDAKDGKELARLLNQLRLLHGEFRVDRETPEKVRLIQTDTLSNVSYLEVRK